MSGTRSKKFNIIKLAIIESLLVRKKNGHLQRMPFDQSVEIAMDVVADCIRENIGTKIKAADYIRQVVCHIEAMESMDFLDYQFEEEEEC
jgi:hypothetical protein